MGWGPVKVGVSPDLFDTHLWRKEAGVLQTEGLYVNGAITAGSYIGVPTPTPISILTARDSTLNPIHGLTNGDALIYSTDLSKWTNWPWPTPWPMRSGRRTWLPWPC